MEEHLFTGSSDYRGTVFLTMNMDVTFRNITKSNQKKHASTQCIFFLLSGVQPCAMKNNRAL